MYFYWNIVQSCLIQNILEHSHTTPITALKKVKSIIYIWAALLDSSRSVKQTMVRFLGITVVV